VLVDTLPDFDVLLIPNTTDHFVGFYDAYDGTFLGLFAAQVSLLSSPVSAIQGPGGNIYVSVQNDDAIRMFDRVGTYLGDFANASDGLDNVRGIDFRNGHLFVCTYANGIIEFSGPHTRAGTFISSTASHWDIKFLGDGSCLVSSSGTNTVMRYNADGTPGPTLYHTRFPEQISLDLADSITYLNASMTADSVRDFQLDGTIDQVTILDGGRGVFRLGNGNLLISSSAGVYEVAPGDIIIEQQSSGASNFIELVTPPQGSDPANVELSPASFVDTVFQGDLADRALYISNIGYENLYYGLHETSSWISVAPDTGIVPGSLIDTAHVTFSALGLTPGTYAASFTVVSNDPEEGVLPVPCTLVVRTPVGVEEGSPGLPVDFALGQNYPNPFNPATRISFSLPTSSPVDLAVYDLLGRRVRTLHEGVLEAGYYEVAWDGLNSGGQPAASGIYLYVLKAGESSQSRRMTLER
jgi:hypothetical protein